MMDYIFTVVFSFLTTIVVTVMYLPQIVKTYKTKTVNDLSTGFWWLLTLYLTLMTIMTLYLALKTGQFGVFITELINLTFGVTVLIQIYFYKNR